MPLAILFSALAMTLIVGARYLLASGGFALATRLRHPGLYAGLGRQIRREIGWSLASAAIYGIPAGVVAWGWAHRGWTRIYTDLHAFPLWVVPLSVLACLLRTMPGSTGRIAGCTGPGCSAACMPCTMPAARPPPGRR